MLNLNLLTQLRDDVAARLASDAWVRDSIPVLSEGARLPDGKPVSVESIEMALAKGGALLGGVSGKQGACIVVMMPAFGAGDADIPGPDGDITIEIQCYHREIYVDANKGGAGKTAEQTGITVANLLHHYMPDGLPGVQGPWLVIAPGVEYVGRDETNGTVSYRIRLRLSASLGRSSHVATPTHTLATGNITLSCATTGAEIWWTQNLTYPGPGNRGGGATQYRSGSPIAEPASPYTLRIAAHDPTGEKIASAIAVVTG